MRHSNLLMKVITPMLDDYLRISQDLGIGIEVADFAQPEIHNNDSEYRKREEILQAVLPTLDVNKTLHSPFRKIVPHSTDKEIRRQSRELLVKAMNTAGRLTCEKMIIHTVYKTSNDSSDELKRMADDFAPFIEELLKMNNVKICIENIRDPDGRFINMLFDRIDHPRFGMCLDLGHVNVFGKITPAEWFKEFNERIIHMHWHDNNGEVDQHFPLGQGTSDWDEITKFYKLFSPQSTITFELKSFSGLEESLNRLRELGIRIR